MKSVLKYFIAIFILVLVCSFRETGENNSAKMVVKNMFTATKQVNSMSYEMKKTERIDGKLMVQESRVKFIKNPFKVYTKQLSPKEGLEVLYVHGTNDNKAIINTNGFPWVNIDLDPYGSTMRNEQHHTIMDIGFSHFIGILEHLFSKYDNELHTMIEQDTVIYNSSRCLHITFTNPNYKIEKYTVKQGEDILSISAKYKISEHKILELNPDLKTYDANITGKTILIPNDYSPKMILYIDEKTNVPMFIKVIDEKGLYEQYEYRQVKLNPVFTEIDFSTKNKAYGF